MKEKASEKAAEVASSQQAAAVQSQQSHERLPTAAWPLIAPTNRNNPSRKKLGRKTRIGRSFLVANNLRRGELGILFCKGEDCGMMDAPLKGSSLLLGIRSGRSKVHENKLINF